MVVQMEEGLKSGRKLSDLIGELGFSDMVVTQLDLADHYGKLADCMGILKDYSQRLLALKKKLIEVGTYPLILLSFLALIMMGLKNYLLPQLEEDNLASYLLNHFPSIFLALLGLMLLILFFLKFRWRRKSRMAFMSSLVKIPILGGFLTTYLTATYAREWGNLLRQGMDLNQVFTIMKGQSSPLFHEIGCDLEEKLLRGLDFSQAIQSYSFFRNELALIIEFGQVKDLLGQELEIYAQKTWDDFFFGLNKLMNLIQPLVFIFIAIMIVLLYAAMLLPLYHNMEVHL